MAYQVSWERLNQVVQQCGLIHNVWDFCVNALHNVQTLVPFDQGRIYFINDNLKVYDEYLLGVEKQITREYHEYYSQLDNNKYSATRRVLNNTYNYPMVMDWTNPQKKDEFYYEHLKPQGICYSTGFLLSDHYGTPKALFCMDRTSYVNYSQVDMKTLYNLIIHLDNLHRNFYIDPPCPKSNVDNNILNEIPLTNRENEIARLLFEGISPQHISDKLFISKTTVYKHITHIHSKLNVSNRQELLVKLRYLLE